MMNGPVFRNYSKQQPSRYIPVQQTQQRSSPKVVSIPVHFVSSDQPTTTISMLKDTAALKIQKVFRGFVVRKSVKKIASIRNEVIEIERRIEDKEVVNMIRRDGKERLRVNETLMSLLFKLDSIRGFDTGIRDLRKAVTKKAIALQEKVDSIALSDNQTLDSDATGEIDPTDNVCTTTSEQVTEASNSFDERVDNEVNSEPIEDDEDGGVVVKEVVEDCNHVKAADGTGGEEAMETSPVTRDVQKQHNYEVYAKENRAIVEDLMGDNDKLKKLMSQISERNEMQTRMINSLSRRVEQLEKAEKQRKKKKTHVSFRRRNIDGFCS